MAIRLSKAIKELNIGLQTAVDFLMKKYNLGDVKIDQNFKLNDDHYESLVEEFKSDKEVRTQAEKIFPKKPKEKKRPEVETHKAETLLESNLATNEQRTRKSERECHQCHCRGRGEAHPFSTQTLGTRGESY